MLKKFVALALLLLFLTEIQLVKAKGTVTILYTGDVLGQIEPLRH